MANIVLRDNGAAPGDINLSGSTTQPVQTAVATWVANDVVSTGAGEGQSAGVNLSTEYIASLTGFNAASFLSAEFEPQETGQASASEIAAEFMGLLSGQTAGVILMVEYQAPSAIPGTDLVQGERLRRLLSLQGSFFRRGPFQWTSS